MTKPRRRPQEAQKAPTEGRDKAEVVPLAGLPVAGERAATILGLKLTGQWDRYSAGSLGARWGTDGEWVRTIAAQVDEALEQLAGKEPPKRLVMHQLLLALSECDQIPDPAKRVAARAKVCAEIAKVTGLVKSPTLQLPGAPPAVTAAALRGASGP